MIKQILIVLCLFALTANAQTKKPAKGGKQKPKTVTTDSTGAESEEPIDPFEALENTLPLETVMDPNTGKKVFYPEVKRKNDSLRKDLAYRIKKEKMTFWARTKYPKPKAAKPEPIQLCMNIVSKDTNLVYCVNDSICKDPEVAKVLFEKQVGDTMFVLIYLDAFSKSKSDGGVCNAGHESKLFFARWNVKTNQAIWKFKNVSSCLKGITNMTKEPIVNWNKSDVLVVKYHRGSVFYEVKFDPQRPDLGLQSAKD
jgi:hypothetical protein